MFAKALAEEIRAFLACKEIKAEINWCGSRQKLQEALEKGLQPDLLFMDIELGDGDGVELVREKVAEGYGVIATGEAGIGNTTTSSAVLSVLLEADVDAVTGRGGGITDESFLKKKQRNYKKYLAEDGE